MNTLNSTPNFKGPKVQGVNLPPGESAPSLVKKRDAMSQGFFANLRDFFTERPAKMPQGTAGGDYGRQQFGTGFKDNLKEWFQGGSKTTGGAEASLRGADAPGIRVEWKPFYKTFFQNVKDLIAPPKLAPLKVTSKAVKVKDIWTKDEVFSRAQVVSILLHIGFAVLLVVPILKVATSEVKAKTNDVLLTPLDLSPYQAKLPPGAKPAGGGGGGGAHEQLPASKGQLPKFSSQQITPPQIIRNPHAALQVEPTLIGPENLRIPSPNMDRWGDPLAKMVNDSNGPGSGGGMGSGSGGGIGSGNGGGLGPGSGGGTGGGAYRAGDGGIGMPVCVYCPRPDYSDEARKSKYQGDVWLEVLVLENGRPSANDIHVTKGLGMGLDEKAIEAVRTWQFKPLIGPNGKAIKVIATVQVQFQLF
jgi:periplasmic protein TonB